VPVRRLIPVLATVLLVTAACSSDDDPSGDAAPDTTVATDPVETTPTDPPVDTTPATDPPTTTAATTIDDDAAPIVDSSVDSAPNSPMVAVVDIVLRDPLQLEATAVSGDHVVEVPRTTAADAGERTLPVVGLRAGRTYDITVRALADGVTDDEVTLQFDVPPLPDWIPDHTVTVIDAERMSPGYTVIETRPKADSDEGDKYMLIAYDEAGEVVWYWVKPGGVGSFEQTPAGTFLTHYWPFGVRETDVLGNVVGNWRPEVAFAEGVDAPDVIPPAADGEPPIVPVTADWVELRTFHHESWPMENGNVLALSTTLHDLTPEQRQTFCPGDPYEFGVISDVAVEFTPDGTVLRTWDLWDAIDVDEHPGFWMCAEPGLFEDELSRDWTHANSVIYDEGRDAIIISVRHTDQVVAFDHLDDEGPQTDVRWILGAGATMPIDGGLTYHQHAAEVLDDGTIVIYDNGNGRPGTGEGTGNPPYSRAVIYDVDDSSEDRSQWTTTQLWQHIVYDDGGLPIFTAFIGDADPLPNGNVLITHGGIGEFPPTEDSMMRALIIEVTREGTDDGEIVWQIDTDPTESHTVYRSERLESFYVGDAWDN
jgi:hypothetical protein